MKLCSLNTLNEGINEFFLNDELYLIVYEKLKNNISVYSSICPHQGGQVRKKDKTFHCPAHNWCFNKNGEGINIKSVNLCKLDSVILNNEVHIESKQFTPPPLPQALESKLSQQNSLIKKSNLTLTLHSHATLELKNDNFCLLCDPWLIGSAFLGAWRNYPKPLIHPKDLKPNAIYISHEHSDHLHPATLNFFDKDTKIYIPSFSNMRMEKKLKELGFKNVNPLNFGQKMKIAGDIFITIYEPASIWNDSQSLIEISGYKILNVNDSGFNRRIAKQIGEIDILCSSFSPGASGYPLTWSHLNNERKVEIFTTQAIAQLEMLTQMAKEFKAKYFLPFASHFILNHPKHLPYMNLMRKNTIQDVVNAFKNERCKVIDLLTGESFSLPNAEFKKLHYAQNLYDKSIIEKYIKEEFDEDEFISQYPTNKFDINKLKKYFLNLNNVPEIKLSEEVVVTIRVLENLTGFSIEIKNGELKILDSIVKNPHITISAPESILACIVDNNESWDEASIGYWCEFHRSPDVYHSEFWRLLQAPYFLKHKNYKSKLDSVICKETPISKILDSKSYLKVLNRYGLYCSICDKAKAETLELASLIHGLTPQNLDRMIKELNAINKI